MGPLQRYQSSLSLLQRVGKVAEKALENLKKGNPYDAVRLLRVVAKLDVEGLQKLKEFPYYASIKPYHEELVNIIASLFNLGTFI